ncbi:hypothetical protein BDV29DRAFT_195345 [Aspergillus leporis]|uniref:Uncharacterized protein n=1 Tax=Aspergillus leporis TaxID=41062 RepID=A0A5N5WP65_9EURO|nr:hypothetical protein BDV29DRAFT_195345 [Aspergillus leporis]
MRILCLPATSSVLARDILQDLQRSDWTPASIVSHDFTSTKRSDSDASSPLDSRDSQESVALTTLGGCLQSSVPGWPKKRPSHDQFEKCVKSATGSVAKRDQSTSISASPLVADGNTGSGICSVANTVLSNFLTGKDMEDLASSVCDTMVTLGGGIITKDAGAIASAITVQGGHKKGLSIVHKHRNLQIIGTVANVAGINIKSKLVNLCVQAIKYQAETCVTDLKYGAFNHQVDHVAKSSTTIWRDSKDAVQAIFDIGFAMPNAFR